MNIYEIESLTYFYYKYGLIYNLMFPVIDTANTFYWFVDTIDGPLNSDWYSIDKNDDILEKYFVYIPKFFNTSTSLHKPGMMSAYGKFITDGECAYYIAIQANNDKESAAKATCIFTEEYNEPYDKYFLKVLNDNAVIYTRYSFYTKIPKWEIIFTNDFPYIYTFIEYHKKQKDIKITKIY